MGKSSSRGGLPRWYSGKEPPASAGDTRDMGSILGWEDPLKEEIATHSSILAWEIPWTEEPGGLQSMGLKELGTAATEHITCKKW